MKTTTPVYSPAPRLAKFCSQCGSPTQRRIPLDDCRERDVCDHCHTIHYQNPRLVVGTLPIWQDKVLLCRRAIEPRYNKWTLPAGFMELNESTAVGALRETQEEAGVNAELGSLFTVIDVPDIEQVHVFYFAHIQNPELNPGPESLEAQYFAESDIPWDELAFRTVKTTLEHFFSLRSRQLPFHTLHYTLS